ncbi:NB-ARC domain-containing protein [Protofrankia coriariae]|uniref:NB-ARC domain-containing protein n=1 Tax=Protofrankia coriariae TaxID=1562887 RepID=UPI000B29FE80|nr:NB-ARC domain-containing protein [Protofrankia coriariae]
MARLDGGRAAARGFQYQYLRTLEAILVASEKPRHHACRVEGPVDPTSLGGQDAVDFDLVDDLGKCLVAAQVKSATPGRRLGAPEALSILVKLATATESERYKLITQAVPDDTCQAFAKSLRDCEGNPATLHYRLTGLFARAPRSLDRVTSLSPMHLARLSRSTIEFDHREIDEIREDLHFAIKSIRLNSQVGLGKHSGGLVLGYLVSETLRRAADPSASRWTLSEFRADVSVEEDILGEALGRRDWGVVAGPVPPIPDIPRDELLERISQNFSSPGVRENSPSVCVLTGLSGIGKSSLAAAFTASFAYRYDLVFWVDASSEDSLVASYLRLWRFLADSTDDRGDQIEISLLRERVHVILQQLPGRWMIVFDDAAPDSVRSWLPRFGRGHILITSVRRNGWNDFQGRFEVEPMSHDEALGLLARRIRISAGEVERHAEALADLVQVLGYWPLAIELASGYIVSCGIDLERIGDYREMVLSRAMDDASSLPLGYPRTLVSAVQVGLERLVRTAERQTGVPLRPLDLLGHMCFVGPSRIPIHLAIVATFIPPEGVPGGPVTAMVMDEADGVVHENIRLLLDISFIRRSEPLISTVDDYVGTDATVSMNSVLQDILRREIEKYGVASTYISRMACHVDRWLSVGMEVGRSEWTWDVAQHAISLAVHIRRLSIKSNISALLIGNIAAFHESQGRAAEAAELLELELAWLAKIENPNELLAIQSRIILAKIYQHGDIDVPDGRVSELLTEDLYNYIDTMSQQEPDAAVYLATNAFFVLQSQVRRDPGDMRLQSLHGRFLDLIQKLPSTPVTELMNDLSSVGFHLEAGRLAEAESSSRRILADGDGSHARPIVEARRLLIESLVMQGRWSEASDEFDLFSAYMGRQSLHQFSVQYLVHNVGSMSALQWVILGDQAAGDFLCLLLDRCGLDGFRDTLTSQDQSRIALIEVVAAAVRGDSSEFIKKAKSLSTVSFAENEDDAMPWELLLRALPARLFHIFGRSYNDQLQARGEELLELADEGTLREIEKVLRNVKVDAFSVLGSHPALAHVGLTTTRILLESRMFSDLTIPVLFLQPHRQIVVSGVTREQIVELQIQRICNSGFRRVYGDHLSVPEVAGAVVRAVNRTLELVDAGGAVRAIATNFSTAEWLDSVRHHRRALVFYGFGFRLDAPKARDAIFASPESWSEALTGAARLGLIAAGLVEWR